MTITIQTEGTSPVTVGERAELAAILKGAGVARLQGTGWIRVSGPDRVRWLNGMVTNSIQQLGSGEGCYCFVLNAQGRIQGDLTAFALEESLLLETEQPEKVAELLERFIIMDDVELTPVDDLAGIAVVGPQALAIVQALGTGNHAALQCTQASYPVQQTLTGNVPRLKQTAYAGGAVFLIHAYSPMVPRFEIWSDPSTMAKIGEELMGTQAVAVSQGALEQLRMLEGTPKYGVDIRNHDTAKDLPQETGQARALHFNKGCYLGQEIVERIRSRGQVHRTFSGFELTGDLPPAGTALEAEGKAVGELTSVTAVALPDGRRVQLGLGYARREALERGQELRYPGGTAAAIALPYTRA